MKSPGVWVANSQLLAMAAKVASSIVLRHNLIIMKGYIYKIENTISGKAYIGQTVRTVEFRWWQHQHPKSKSVALKDAIKKYGAHVFKVVTLQEVMAPNKEELCKTLNYLER